MTALLYLLGVLLFVFAVLVSIALHEVGHMVPAKKFGAKVTQYFIGFGPTVWSTQRGETEYGVKAIPLGGYVKIIGMLPPGTAADSNEAEHLGYDEDGAPIHKIRKSNTGIFGQLISDARIAEWELVQPGDEDRLFYKMTWWKKVIVMAGGPTVNIVIAFLCFWGIFATYGDRSLEVTPGAPVVAEVSECMIPYAEAGRECTADDPVTPAAAADIQAGDQIVGFNGVAVTGWEQFRGLIQANEDGAAVIELVRDGQQMTVQTNTTVSLRPTNAEDETLSEVGFLGVSPTIREVVTMGGPLYTMNWMGERSVEVAEVIVKLPAKVWNVAQAIVGVEERDRTGPVSIVGGGRYAGEAVSAETDAFGLPLGVTEKTVFLVMLAGIFNLFIGLFNFLPLLPLDGGHIASALWEAIRRGVARLRGRPDPGYVDAAKLLPVAYVAGSFILLMGVVLIIGDLVVPISLYG